MYFDPAEMGAFVNGLGSNFLILLLSVLPILGANRRLSRSVLTVTDQIIRTTWLCVFVVFIIWTPMDFLGGFLIDSRQVVLTLGAFFLGPIPAFFAVIAGTIARAIASPVGVIFGFWSLFASAIVGLGFRFWAVRMRRTPNIGFFLLMGFSAQVVWHSSSVFLPKNIFVYFWQELSIYMFTVFPLITGFFGIFIQSRITAQELFDKETNEKQTYRELYNKLTSAMVTVDLSEQAVAKHGTHNIPILESNLASKAILPTKALQENNLLKAVSSVSEDIRSQLIKASESKGGKIDLMIEMNDGESRTYQAEVYDHSSNKHSRSKIAILLTDITKETKIKRLNWRLANTDPVTGLANRKVLERELSLLQSNKEEGEDIYMLYLHLSELFHINSKLGHDNGDTYIRLLSGRLQIINKDAIIGRIGGSSFAMLFKERSLAVDQSKAIESNVMQVLSQPLKLKGQFIPIRAGVALVRLNQMIFSDAYACAKMTAERKTSHQNISFSHFDQDAYLAFERLNALKAALTLAIEENTFDVFYQPIICLKTNRILKAEALVRWQHPVLGFISPGEFIPLAEKEGVITQVDLSVRKKALAQVADWHEQGLACQVSLNASPLELGHQAFSVSSLLAQLEALNVPASLLCIEITEQSFTKRDSVTKNWLSEMKQTELSIAIDDFGIGYSNLSQLKNLSAYTGFLKIDQSLISDIETDQRVMAMVKSIVDIASTFNMQVVLEGIETAEQHHLVSTLDQVMVQGYYYHRPMPADDFTKLLIDQK